MGMSTHVVGIRKSDDQHEAKRKAWIACEAASIEPPDALKEYFFGNDMEGHDPSEDPTVGLTLEIEHTNYNREYETGIEVNLADLPKDVHTIRFYTSY